MYNYTSLLGLKSGRNFNPFFIFEEMEEIKNYEYSGN